MRDPYRVLGVPPDAKRRTILDAFRTLAQEHHPDRGGDAALMQVINEAWAILGRPDHRQAYDDAKAAALARVRERRAERAASAAGASVQSPSRAATATADPPPGSSSVPRPPERERRADTLDYGRYEGWTIRELSRHDPDYLLWLARTPAGRVYRRWILEALAERESQLVTPLPTPKRRTGMFR